VFTAKGTLIWGVCALFFLYEFFLRTVIGSFQMPLTEDLSLSSLEFSFLSSTLFLLVYGVMQVPVGFIVNKIGLKRSLLMGSAICAIACIGFSLSQNYLLAAFFRSLMGLGASFGFICLLVSVNEWIPYRVNAFFIGISQLIGTIGPMLAAGPLISFLNATKMDWRTFFLYTGFTGIFLGVLILLVVQNPLQKEGKHIILKRPKKITADIIKIFSRVQVWYIAIFSACIYFSLEYLAENEGRAFLLLKNIDIESASYMITLSWLGQAIGCPTVGFISDLICRRKIVMVVTSILNILSIAAIVIFKNEIALQVAFFLFGFGASGQSIGFSNIAEQFKREFTAVAFAVNNMMLTFIPAILAPVIGGVFDYTKTRPEEVLSDYYVIFYFLLSIASIAVLCSIFFIYETYCKSKVEFTYLKFGK